MSSNQNYKQRLLRLSELQSKAGSTLYERVELAVLIFEDADFRFDHGNADDFRCGEIINRHFDDTAWQFLDLLAIYRKFPDASQWTRVRDLFAKVNEKPEVEEKSAKPARRATLQQVEDLTDQVKSLEAQRKYQDTILQDRAKTVEELLLENADLKQRLAVAEGRILELERMLGKQLAAA